MYMRIDEKEKQADKKVADFKLKNPEKDRFILVNSGGEPVELDLAMCKQNTKINASQTR